MLAACLAVVIWAVPPEPARAQDRVLIPVDLVATVDSIIVIVDGTGSGVVSLPDGALPSTVRMYADRDRTQRLVVRHVDASHIMVTGVAVPIGGLAWLYRSYRVIPVAPLTRYAASSVVPPSDPDSVSNFAQVPRTQSAGASDPSDPSDPFGGSRLNRSGSITRGVIAGNRRDATIESGLRMELSGEIVDGVNLRAVLSDENTPIVPEGTTQRIDEFDKVFIEIESANARAQLGDFELGLGRSSYASITRKLQGAQVGVNWNTGSTLAGSGTATVAGATARGVFRSQTLQILEGVQGPYRLEGNSGERFIILIPGSETVFLDGIQLQRGATADYVVDYATAEITFTSRRVMSADRRVSVEFQYTTNQFTRTLLATEVGAGLWSRADGSPRVNLGFTLVREADGNQFLDEFGLSAADSLLLAEAGDGRASRSGAVAVEYDPEAPYVHYIREIRTVGASTDTVFVALTAEPPPDTTVYRVQFSRVTPGTGRYARVGRSINGILYEYVGPGAGEYEPLRLLPQPRRQQIFDVRAALEPISGLTVDAEWARSELDMNRLSSLDADDDAGNALRLGARFESPKFDLPLLLRSSLTAGLSRSRRDATFTTFDRVRSVEFSREWNLPFDTPTTAGVAGQSETITSSFAALTSDVGTARVEVGRLDLGETFVANRTVARAQSSDSVDAVARYLGEWIRTELGTEGLRGSWLRQFGRAGYRLANRRLEPYVEVEFEDRRESSDMADSLRARSIRSSEIRPGLQWTHESTTASIMAEVRHEDRPLAGVFGDALTAHTLLASFGFRPDASFRIDANVGIRNTKTHEAAAPSLAEDRRSVVLGLNGDYRPFERAVSLSWLYEAQTERTPRMQEIYVRIGPEQGEYVWIDENGDNAIQIEELVRETTPNEGTYARTFVPSDSLFAIVGVHARVRLDIRPDRMLRGRDSWLARVLSSISTATTVEITEKNRSEDTFALYALRQSRFRVPGSTLNGRILVRQDLSVSPPGSRFAADFSVHRVTSLADLAAGLEERRLGYASADLRYRVSNKLRFSAGGRLEQNRVESETFASRTFDLRSTVIDGEATVDFSTRASVSAGADFAWKDDRFTNRSATVIKVPVTMRYRRPRGYQLMGRVEMADVRLKGEASGLAAFELTDGRGAGRSMLWSVTGEYAFNRYLRGSVAYDGRAPAGAPVIHTMRMQLSAAF